jgi:hypothetical protein
MIPRSTCRIMGRDVHTHCAQLTLTRTQKGGTSMFASQELYHWEGIRSPKSTRRPEEGIRRNCRFVGNTYAGRARQTLRIAIRGRKVRISTFHSKGDKSKAIIPFQEWSNPPSIEFDNLWNVGF